MNAGVPITTPVRVAVASPGPCSLAIPKSISLTVGCAGSPTRIQVVRLEVAVDHPARVHGRQHRARLPEDVHRVGDRQPPVAVEPLPEVLADQPLR
jgi:hypothetical protein